MSYYEISAEELRDMTEEQIKSEIHGFEVMKATCPDYHRAHIQELIELCNQELKHRQSVPAE